MSTPTVASYCTTFLKPEMLHIYRQVTGLRRYHTFVLTRQRQCEEQFPFDDIEWFSKKKLRKNFIRRFWLKHIRKLPPIYYRGEFSVLNRTLDRRKTDLMHVYFGHTGVHLLPFIRQWDKPSVVSFHGMDIQQRPQEEGYDQKMQELLQTVPLVLARSLSLAERIEALGCSPEKIRINRTGIPLSQFPFYSRAVPADGAWQFVQACRLIPKKGLLTALKAFASFHRQFSRARFVIAGEGKMEMDLREEVGELGLGGAVELKGFLGQGELCELYARSHIFMHPSELTADQNQEGIPNSMLEAMATGLPVLATLHGGIPEAVESGVTGLLVPERDHAALLQAMLNLTGDPQRWLAYGEAASNAVRKNFEDGPQIEKLESYYDEAREISGKAS